MLALNFGECKVNANATYNHYTVMADSVRWLGQSDSSVWISILLEFY